MQVKLVDRYLFKQVLFAGLTCVILFMIVWIAPELLLRTVQRVLSGQYTVRTGFDIIVCEIPKILGNALPVGMLLGSLFTFDKLSKDFELTVFRGIGMSFWRIISPIIILGMLTGIFSFIIHDTMIPVTSSKLNGIKHENPESHFVFPVKDDNGKMQKIIIVSNFDNTKIKDVIVLNFFASDAPGESVLRSIYRSDYATYKDGQWVLNETVNYGISKQGVFKEIDTFHQIPILKGDRADRAYKLMMYSVKRDRELTNAKMFDYITLLKKESMDDEFRFMMNKYLQRYSHAIMCVLFAIFGCLLGFSQPREQRLIGFTVAVATIFLYYITMPFFDMLAEKGLASPIITSFVQPVAIIAAIIWLKKQKDL